jgi:hypothetical protein
MKPTFTEEEIEEMNYLYMDTGYQSAIGEVMNFLKKLGYSDVNAIVIELRKEFIIKKMKEKMDIRQQKYPNSTLNDKLCARLDWTEQNKFGK